MRGGGWDSTGALVWDNIEEIEPPANTDDAVARIAAMFKRYDITVVYGDGFAFTFVAQEFLRHGITLKLARHLPKDGVAEDAAPMMDRSAIYMQAVKHMTARPARVRLLDHPKTIAQFIGLQRKAQSGSGDKIDHPPGGHDDCSNVVALALAKAVVPINAPGLIWEKMGILQEFEEAHGMLGPPCRVPNCAYCVGRPGTWAAWR